ncbi:PH domain-containing protein [Paenibacillus ehimensis]|uniref:PH domain-containing protein n=1 Tax=Paenibacillus ehimensis TaxID=79264 RepID=A0ABT8VLC3_9BACL|nr:PH domain-containing protein [Paenibacillus ehimensis]MDO3681780.1 PH domain-containing protein [Paenibacillus ehimensis]MEC0211883.1 PH domain-containing protein [Paenibacillus ehimensis]
MRFEPQRDTAFAFMFGIIVLLLLAVIVAIWFAPATLGEKIPLILVVMVFETFFLLVWYNTYYVITDTHLIIVLGIFKSKIPLDSITSVTRTKTLLAGPAFSTNRLSIQYNNGMSFAHVAPKDREAFVSALRRHFSDRIPIKLD